MNRLAFIALLAASIAAPFPAGAQLFRAYLASYGADTNPCTIDAPCRLLPTALNAVASGGEIWMLDSANYNTSTVNVFKSVTIQAVPGQVGSIVSMGGPGASAMVIYVPGGNVGLRNLAFTSMATNPGGHGVLLSASVTPTGTVQPADTLSIEDCTFTDLPSQAIYIVASTKVHVKRSTFRNVGGSAVRAQEGATVDVSNSHILSSQGVVAYASQAATTAVTVSDSEIAGAAGASSAVYAQSVAQGGVAKVFLNHTIVHDMGTGLHCTASNGGSAAIYVRGSTVTRNQQGLYILGSGATVYSLGDNLIADNASADVGALTPVSAR